MKISTNGVKGRKERYKNRTRIIPTHLQERENKGNRDSKQEQQQNNNKRPEEALCSQLRLRDRAGGGEGEGVGGRIVVEMADVESDKSMAVKCGFDRKTVIERERRRRKGRGIG